MRRSQWPFSRINLFIASFKSRTSASSSFPKRQARGEEHTGQHYTGESAYVWMHCEGRTSPRGDVLGKVYGMLTTNHLEFPQLFFRFLQALVFAISQLHQHFHITLLNTVSLPTEPQPHKPRRRIVAMRLERLNEGAQTYKINERPILMLAIEPRRK